MRKALSEDKITFNDKCRIVRLKKSNCLDEKHTTLNQQVKIQIWGFLRKQQSIRKEPLENNHEKQNKTKAAKLQSLENHIYSFGSTVTPSTADRKNSNFSSSFISSAVPVTTTPNIYI